MYGRAAQLSVNLKTAESYLKSVGYTPNDLYRMVDEMETAAMHLGETSDRMCGEEMDS